MPLETRPGFTIRIFLHDGTPDGLRFVEKSNWTGLGFVCPRSRFPTAKSRPELKKAGVYLLIGPGAGDMPTIYIGEGDPAGPRLDQHFARKDFWTSFVLFTSKDANLNKAHVQYLEASLVELATKAKRSTIDNGNLPQKPSLSEADTAEIEGFLGEMLLIYPVLGISVFEEPKGAPSTATILTLKGKGAEAKGYEAPSGFVVLRGSTARLDTVPSIHPYLSDLRNALLGRGVLAREGDHLRIEQDYTFDSPSTAAGVMLGRSANGRIEWKDGLGRELKEIQEGALGASTAGG